MVRGLVNGAVDGFIVRLNRDGKSGSFDDLLFSGAGAGGVFHLFVGQDVVSPPLEDDVEYYVKVWSVKDSIQVNGSMRQLCLAFDEGTTPRRDWTDYGAVSGVRGSGTCDASLVPD